MKIVLLGYGKMGKAIESFAVKKGHTIMAKIDSPQADSVSQIKNADVAIEFSQPDAVVNNLKACIDAKVPVVCGTTGWLTNKNEIEDYCVQQNGTFFYASNFSLGVNIFFKVNEQLAEIMNKYPGYDISIDEIHHTQKKDAPSGTAISLATSIIKKVDRKNSWVNNNNADAEKLVINSFREDPTPGTHTVKYTSSTDDIALTHVAHSRDGFAKGALMVAEWIQDKKGVLNMGDFLKL